MNLKEIHEYLLENRYVMEFQGKLYTTSKYKRDLAKVEVSKLPQKINTGLSLPTVIESSKERFKRFIEEAEVPYRIAMQDGRTFTANAYNIKAERVFNKALADGVNYKGLVFSTKLYYKSHGFKQKISNYFVEGTWEAEYDQFMKKMASGDIVGHIKKTTDDNSESKFGRDL